MRILLIGFFLMGCGYRVSHVPDTFRAPTISVPYVEGDEDGKLTSAIVQEISLSGRYIYRPCGGEWTLQVRLVDESYENIGFRYDRTKKGHLKHYIIPVEMREGVLVEVQLVQESTQAVVRGPNRLQAELEYDHDYYSIRDHVNVFSLGQLTDIDSAEDAAKTPLYHRLAEKIVSWLIWIDPEL